ncbi:MULTISPECIES: DUF2269 domain-containing protein [unclassified Phyllobacterium]|uniref:DUF2269 family protein n=1 Tax=Phyllobacterium TaxID=28100 RepID=UPI000DD76228|nr:MULTISPECIES: DUF2269 domain-containing protein [unclassified Phyllobacterium]MBA8900833.1 putative membrane protein [Phyllobacterium sp. P30BS-XVII]UGX86753.1 DUF2269 domain-containing protein [Phyllobacterium sp. T1293]
MLYQDILRLIHVIGATVLFGTGSGIAFFMVMAHRTRNAAIISHVASIVVLADTVFTASAVILQPISGYLLAKSIGWPLDTPWIALSLGLYVLIGLFWLPVVWIQIQLRDIATEAVASGTELPTRYYKLYNIWFVCGFPAFAAVIAIFWLMLTKPDLSW